MNSHEINYLFNLISHLESELENDVILDGSMATLLTLHAAFPDRVQEYIGAVGEPNDYDFLCQTRTIRVEMPRIFGYVRKQERQERSSTYEYVGSDGQKSFDLTLETRCKFGIVDVFGQKIKVRHCDALLAGYQELIRSSITLTCSAEAIDGTISQFVNDCDSAMSRKNNANIEKMVVLSQISERIKAGISPYISSDESVEKVFVRGKGLFDDL